MNKQQKRTQMDAEQEEKNLKYIETSTVEILDTSDEEDTGPPALAVYPPRARGLTLYEYDLECLAPGVYLNDQVVNFMLKTYCLDEAGKVRNPITKLCDSHVFSQLVHKVDRRHVQHNDAQLLANVERVQRFYRGSSLFDAQWVIMPICDSNHWFLVVINKIAPEEYHLLMLDSYGHGVRGYATSIIRATLSQMLQFPIKVQTTHVVTPQQINLIDCGLHMLYNANCVLQLITNNPHASVQELQEILKKGPMPSRSEIVQRIRIIADDQRKEPKQTLDQELKGEEIMTVPAETTATCDDIVKIINKSSTDWNLIVAQMYEIARLCRFAGEDLQQKQCRRLRFKRKVGGDTVIFHISRKTPWIVIYQGQTNK